jgi:hypothetical protein
MTKDWPSIVARYAEAATSDPSIAGIAALARHIQETELSSGLFGWASMFDLCITQTEASYPYDGPYLRVAPRLEGMVEFRYIDTRVEAQQWQRTVPATEVIPRLHSFLGQLHWFVEQR